MYSKNNRDEMLTEPVSVLYRPVGKAELEKIEKSNFRAFPPRLPEQPIFYVVMTLEYAVQIAKDWNTRDERSGFSGYVTRFRVRADYLGRYDIRIVGSSRIHREYWIPAEAIDEFNANIVGEIEVVEKFILEKNQPCT